MLAFHASQDFEARLGRDISTIASEVETALGDHLAALVLGGGYGRGEGGVVIRDGLEYPYNDLDFTLILHTSQSDRLAALEPIRKKWAAKLGIHVDFSRPLTPDEIGRLPRKLMWQDLLLGHQVVAGDPGLLARLAPASLREPLPIIEATHLLLNRGAGLLWAWRQIHGFERREDEDFVRRNFFKAVLALGDALLIAHKRYQTPYRGRDTLLGGLLPHLAIPDGKRLFDLYSEALVFKFKPDSGQFRGDGRQRLADLGALWWDIYRRIESMRTGQEFPTPGAYRRWAGLRQSEEHLPRLLPRNIWHNIHNSVISFLYPREWLFRSLPVLLQRAPRGGAWLDRVSERFMAVWQRFN